MFLGGIDPIKMFWVGEWVSGSCAGPGMLGGCFTVGQKILKSEMDILIFMGKYSKTFFVKLIYYLISRVFLA